MKIVRDFAKIGQGEVALAGGKGASLGGMVRAGMPVPPGFVILSPAFEKFLKENNLEAEIASLLASLDFQKASEVEKVSQKINALFQRAKIPGDIEAEIQKHFKKLRCQYVAVRSSATAEDSKKAAWAGQLESYLNIPQNKLLESVKKCWASLFAPRALYYRFEKNLQKEKIAVAVVVQKMVKSEKSGIAFSLHPVTQNKNQVVIEAGWGLGEAVVAGQITPDRYIVEKQPRRIAEKNIETQAKELYCSKKGGRSWRSLSQKQANQQVLLDKEILRLSKIVCQAEKLFGFPVDLEWTLAKKKFFVLQSRPITALKKSAAQSRSYINHVSRDMSLTAIYYAFLTASGLAPSPFGFESKDTFYFSTRSFLKGYKSAADNQQMYGQIRKLAKEGKWPKILKTFQRLIQQRKKLTQNFLKADLNKKSRQWIARQFKKFHQFYLKYWAYHLFAFNLDKAVQNTPFQKLLKENEKLLRAVRSHNPFLFFDEEYLPHLFDYLAKKIPVSRNLLFFLTPEEILKLIENRNGIDWEEIKKRSKHYLLRRVGDKAVILSARAALAEYKKIISPPKRPVKAEIKGESAYQGKVIGRAKIVLLKKDLPNIPPHSILVAPQTTPEFTPQLKKVAAIVTDEGGILCHAAIISRELKKPCVIGTKIATQVLKDGDWVEVNANEGIVRVLK